MPNTQRIKSRVTAEKPTLNEGRGGNKPSQIKPVLLRGTTKPVIGTPRKF